MGSTGGIRHRSGSLTAKQIYDLESAGNVLRTAMSVPAWLATNPSRAGDGFERAEPDRSFMRRSRSELVADAGAHGIDAGIDFDRRSALYSHSARRNNPANQHDIDADTRGIADRQGWLCFACGRHERSAVGTWHGRVRSRGPNGCTDDGRCWHCPGRPTEHIRQEASDGVSRSGTQRGHIRDRDRISGCHVDRVDMIVARGAGLVRWPGADDEPPDLPCI